MILESAAVCATLLAGGAGYWLGYRSGREAGRLQLRIEYEAEIDVMQRDLTQARRVADAQRSKQTAQIESAEARQWLETWR